LACQSLEQNSADLSISFCCGLSGAVCLLALVASRVAYVLQLIFKASVAQL